MALTWSEVWWTWKRGKNPCAMAWNTMLNTAEMRACRMGSSEGQPVSQLSISRLNATDKIATQLAQSNIPQHAVS